MNQAHTFPGCASFCKRTYVLFLLRQEKYQKNATKGALRKGAPFGIPRRTAARCPKMFRFLNTYPVKDWKFPAF